MEKPTATNVEAPTMPDQYREQLIEQAFPNGAEGPAGVLLRDYQTLITNSEYLAEEHNKLQKKYYAMQSKFIALQAMYVVFSREASQKPNIQTISVYNAVESVFANLENRTPRYKEIPEQAMNLQTYQDRAATTAQYPNSGELGGLLYTILGLTGEAGETADQTKKILRDDDSVLTAERYDKLKKELGDALWYLANACRELGMLAQKQGFASTSLEDVAEHNLQKLADRKRRGMICGDGGMR